jgi:hypothetical protein
MPDAIPDERPARKVTLFCTGTVEYEGEPARTVALALRASDLGTGLLWVVEDGETMWSVLGTPEGKGRDLFDAVARAGEAHGVLAGIAGGSG